MSTWTRQKGYPVITLTKTDNGYVAEQQRFLIDPEAHSKPDTPSPFGYKWEVPLTLITSESEERQLVWMHKDGEKVKV